MSALREDAAAMPRVFDIRDPMPHTVVGEWVARQSQPVPADLSAVWTTLGAGDMFETEELFGPGADPDHDIEMANTYYRECGLNSEYLVFHSGLYLTAISGSGLITQIDRDSLLPVGTFASIDDWYRDLRREYGSRYGLQP